MGDNLTDFKSDAGNELDRAVNRARITWEWWIIILSVIYFSTHLIPWLAHGRPVYRSVDAYRATKSGAWVVDKDIIKIEALMR